MVTICWAPCHMQPFKWIYSVFLVERGTVITSQHRMELQLTDPMSRSSTIELCGRPLCSVGIIVFGLRPIQFLRKDACKNLNSKRMLNVKHSYHLGGFLCVGSFDSCSFSSSSLFF
eukprot:TRINITY_DN67856_c2_g2_i1.p1 TRINITY_DN67856_c2_g2~~TRINITY_DN67856_c2_g2_i1.p1  ORF type:complete len:116 (+),score=1.04 TRINITY_DN67856_c2_g2_i1:255-602(+)